MRGRSLSVALVSRRLVGAVVGWLQCIAVVVCCCLWFGVALVGINCGLLVVFVVVLGVCCWCLLWLCVVRCGLRLLLLLSVVVVDGVAC